MDVRLNINGKEVIAQNGMTILEAATANNIDIPTLCHDERVEAYGSCGICVVEVDGVPKLLRACATKIESGMIIKTKTERVKKSRKLALELLLSDHAGDCRPPCITACPGNTDCQGYVGLIANGKYEEAVKLIKEQLPLPASIGRVCPHPCESACRRGLLDEPISIAWLKRFVADIDLKDDSAFIPEIKPSTGKRVAIIGGGPGGLTAAYYLAQEGHKVVIYDQMPQMGGMLRYGIPQYRLPKEILNKEIGIIEKMGVKMLNHIKVGRDIEFNHIQSYFDVVYISIGAWISSGINCPGEDLEGVIGGINFLTKFAMNEPIRTGNRIAVVGGGNTAMDACRASIRLGATEVTSIYRRTKEEMPADDIEILEAEEEGVNFKFLSNPMEILEKDGRVCGIRLQKMKLGEPDASGRRSPVPIVGEEEIIEVDSVIVAIGQDVDAAGFTGVGLSRWGMIEVDSNSFQTNIPGVFAGGDAVNSSNRIAIQSIGDAKKAAEVINAYLQGEHIPYKKPIYSEQHLTKEDFLDFEMMKRPHMPHLSPKVRKNSFEEVVTGYSEEAAVADAMRCLECGCHDVFECKLVAYANEYNAQPKAFEGEVHNCKSDDKHPFIVRDSDKCILCGLCVRTCEDVMGVGAIGLVDRGFDTIVKPGLDTPLKETNCISCGQCVTVCPTGALQERLMIKKSVPVKPTETNTICSYCSVGCEININSVDDLLIRAVPVNSDRLEKGLLCVKGRFGFNIAQSPEKLTKPLIRKDNVLTEVSWEEALLYTAKKAQALSLLYGSNALALSLSDRYTNEEIFLATQFGQKVLKTDNITSFNSKSGGIINVLGYDASSNTLDELMSTETIIVIGSDLIKEHTIVGVKIKESVKAGAKLISISSKATFLDQWAQLAIEDNDDISLLKEVQKHLIDLGCRPSNANGFEELQKDLESIIPGEIAKEIAAIYKNSKKAMIVFGQNDVTEDAARIIGNLSVLSGHIGKPHRGIIQLKPQSNSQGLRDIGIKADIDTIKEEIKNDNIKGLLVFGEDIKDFDLSSLEFLMVQDVFLTETAKQADVVFPAASPLESRGTYTNSERKIQQLNQVIKPSHGYENWQLIVKLANTLGTNLLYKHSKDILNKIASVHNEYFKVDLEKMFNYWPVTCSPVLYENGFNFTDKKANLVTVGNGQIFTEKRTTDDLTNRFLEKLIKEELI
ncbi:molybdopterin-dependent oxidoreductase [Serpentinicella alkaliphila]|uniref:Formate dehydrogenase major subunit n=1 Tax=Serpentinicella alkaliphila TaxID=1734049 RepID=A0A4V2T4U7_9FIRM|nr:molybdopterin-dependent oxidoreductase [Serpentinicella alkaliphila]QUH25682.1 molybdopterin-dependent oxidoreductase [Serpentinicella alkaliphila]TCQ06604.1 formate dehydrogenase major subunit [Serpentinicella alkaliphila]